MDTTAFEDRLYKVASILLPRAHEGWSAIILNVTLDTEDVSTLSGQCTTPDGVFQLDVTAEDVGNLDDIFRDIRNLTARPDKPAWCSAIFHLKNTGEVEIKFGFEDGQASVG
ncbi:MAG TPA: hypothetical protein PKB11_07375 [Desulfovibrio sp.]|uniref:hypothetical protein n=1 Tax=Desulfovibrio sp. TaxID=885 RepID=UPI002B612969|nr:hypothetical protein [Desulfovibrio sp.]HMM38563.1 hypothetical protein [Desulfovibrio sp.]